MTDKPYRPEGVALTGLEDWFIHEGMPRDPADHLWGRYNDANPDDPMPKSLFEESIRALQAHYKPKPASNRPTLYDPSVIDYICQELSKGIPLTAICRGDAILAEKADPLNDIHTRPDVMPAPRTIRTWESERPDVAAAIARAREDCETAIFEECLTIADDGRRDYEITDLGPTINHDHIQRTKIRIDTRLKLLAKINPKRYGDKVQHADADGNKLEPATFVLQPVAPPPREE